MSHRHHPIVIAAAEGTLPDWAVAGAERRAHMRRVSELLGTWAVDRGLDEAEQTRWRAVGYLHDVVREEEPNVLRGRVPEVWAGLPDGLLHGPAGADRLRVAGVADGELLHAIAWHTAGSEDFGTLGRALYAADFLEPGRPFRTEWRADLRARAAEELDGVVVEIVRARIEHLLSRRGTVLPRTMAFWNALAVERAR
ncbi:MAG: HD domain-containing protein [Gemmatimonadota bacterium]